MWVQPSCYGGCWASGEGVTVVAWPTEVEAVAVCVTFQDQARWGSERASDMVGVGDDDVVEAVVADGDDGADGGRFLRRATWPRRQVRTSEDVEESSKSRMRCWRDGGR